MALEFSNSYFEDEIREGFYVPGILKRTWAAQQEILVAIDDICQKNGIRWFADWGTLLGAVRHQGYVPWDDDIDICMFREDYEKFLRVVKEYNPSNLIVQTLYDEEHPRLSTFICVANTYEYNYTEEFLNKYHDFGIFAGVDVFPLDYVSRDKKAEQARCDVIDALRNVLPYFNKELFDEKENEKIEKIDIDPLITEVEKITKKAIRRELPKQQQVYIAIDLMAKLFENTTADEVAIMDVYINNRHMKGKKQWFKNIVQLPFEGIKINAPYKYHEWLTCEYGDYMKPVRGSADHDFLYFQKYEEDVKKEVIKQSGKYNFQYKFKPEDIENANICNPNWEERIINFSNVMKRAYGLMLQSIMSSDYKTAIETMESCQKAAINIGTDFEERYLNSSVVINSLEKYCECLYLSTEAIYTNDFEKLLQYIEGISEKLDAFISGALTIVHETKEVVFFPIKAEYWYRFDQEYKTAVKKGFQVYVIPIPYYYINALGKATDKQYSTEGYPEYVQLVDYNTYDVEKRHPDIIYIQSPYDECNYTTSVEPYFYAKNLKKNTDKLIYKPYFVMDSLNLQDASLKKVMDFFVASPGVVYADEVCVQDKDTRKAYIDYLTEIAGEEYRDNWERKIRTEE